jgi:hypothetical protein
MKKGEHTTGKMKELKPYIKKQETRMRKLGKYFYRHNIKLRKSYWARTNLVNKRKLASITVQ